ncbi:MAG: hypothetical protein K0S65_1048 [Labilithrix sp.]|nr:hypothetical protein [Labilithrix sp.]
MAEPVTVESMGNVPPNIAAERTRARAAELWRSVSSSLRRPAIGASVAGATVLAAGALWGVTEAAFAGVAAWAVFRTLKKRAEKRRTEATESPEGPGAQHRNGTYPA